MNKSKPVAKKEKATAPKKVTDRKPETSAKPAKLGGVPNLGRVGRS